MACFKWVDIHNAIIVIFCLTTNFEACSGEGLNVEKVSPETLSVSLGQPLRLQINLHRLDIDKWNTTGCWSFYNSNPNNITDLVLLRKIGQYDSFNYSYSPRASAERQADLLLINTTLKDTGKYMFMFRRPPSKLWNTSVLFSVTVEEKPRVEITCPNTVRLREGDKFSCYCKAIPLSIISNVSWIKEGQMIRKTNQLSQNLSFEHFSKDMIGTYICRANIGTLIDEKTVKISVIQSEQNATEQQINSVKGWRKFQAIIISASIGVSGIFLGILITLGIQWILGKKQNSVPAPEHEYERPMDYLPRTMLSDNEAVHHKPAYEELDFTRVEENGNSTYQGLLLNAMEENKQ